MLQIAGRNANKLTCSSASLARQVTAVVSPSHQHIQNRTFVDAFLNSALGPCPLRRLSHSKTMPYSSSSIFSAISDVSGYPAFLPFTISSKVTARDEAGYPTKASLRVGYEKFGLEENWDSVVQCDPAQGILKAKSSVQNSGGLFDVLQTRWQVGEAGQEDGQSTLVTLNLNVKFRNPVYDQMFARVEGKVAASMIEAFEKRIHEIESRK